MVLPIPGLTKAKTIADQLEHYESHLTADFQRVYGLRLADTINQRTYQEIIDLVMWLPSDSAFMSAYRAEGDGRKTREMFQWGLLHDLVLAQCNLQQQFNWMYAQAHSKNKIKRPEPISGPFSDSPRKPAGGDANAMARAMLAEARKG